MSKQSMRVMVTGGSGFIGGFIVDQLAAEGHEVLIYDIAKPEFTLPHNVVYVNGDTRYADQLTAAMQGCEEVYDVAGVLGTSELMLCNEQSVDVNIRGAVNVLEAARRNKVSRVFHPTKPNDWLNTYSITKFAAEQFCFMFQQNFGMQVAVLKWFNAYGPRQHLYPVRKAVPLFIAQALRGQPLEVFGDGEQTVDMIYVTDIAKIAIRACRELGRSSKVIDVGCGLPITVNQLAQKIIDACGSKSEIKHLPMRSGEPSRSDIRADVVELRKLISVDSLTEFGPGLDQTIAYYRDVVTADEHDRAFDHFEKFGKRSFPL